MISIHICDTILFLIMAEAQNKKQLLDAYNMTVVKSHPETKLFYEDMVLGIRQE